MKKRIVVYKENSKMFITNEENFFREVRNNLEINEAIGFSSLEDLSDYIENHFPQYEVIISKL